VCDLVEVALLEQLERRVLAERQVSMMVLVRTGEGELPDLDSARRSFLESLNEEPERLDAEREDLLIALGLR
jgi:hypothetical protein